MNKKIFVRDKIVGLICSNPLFAPVCAEFSGAVHSEDLDCFVGLRSPRNDEKLVSSYQAQIFTPRNDDELVTSYQDQTFTPGFPDLRSENDSKPNVPSPTGGRLGLGITHREKTNVMADWFRHRIDCCRNSLPMRFRVKHGMTEEGSVVISSLYRGRIKVGAIPKGVKHSTSQLGIANTNLEVRCKTC